MDLQVSTDSSVQSSEHLTKNVESVVSGKLSRFTHQITRLDVHLVNENAGTSGGKDKRCTIEAHVAGHQSVAVSHNATSLEAAYAGATRKLSNLLNSKLGKLDGYKGDQPMEGPAPS